MTIFIENVSRRDIVCGFHMQPNEKTVLIQITETTFPTPKYKFNEVHQFFFDDVENESESNAITDDQAKAIALVLQDCVRNGKDVIVHCQAGLCRSGAVAEVGIILGMNPPDRNRIPNTLVKQKLLKALNMQVDAETSAFNFMIDDFGNVLPN